MIIYTCQLTTEAEKDITDETDGKITEEQFGAFRFVPLLKDKAND